MWSRSRYEASCIVSCRVALRIYGQPEGVVRGELDRAVRRAAQAAVLGTERQ